MRCMSVDLEIRRCMSGGVDGTVGVWDMEECKSEDSYLSAKFGPQLQMHVDWREEVWGPTDATKRRALILVNTQNGFPRTLLS